MMETNTLSTDSSDGADDDDSTTALLENRSVGPKEKGQEKEPALPVLQPIRSSREGRYAMHSTDVFKDLQDQGCSKRCSRLNSPNEEVQHLPGCRKYSTSVTKTKAADYGHIKWIEDLVPNSMWSQTIVKYDKFALWGISHWGKKRRQFYAFATLRESARDVYSKRRIIAVTKVEIVEWHDYKHLDWITVRRDDDVLYKFKEGDFHRLRIQDIEDMLLLLVQGKVTNLSIEERIAFNVSLRMFTRRVVIQRRVEDLQLGVESYQKKLNLTKPDTYRSNLRRQDAYTKYSIPSGFIYENKDQEDTIDGVLSNSTSSAMVLIDDVRHGPSDAMHNPLPATQSQKDFVSKLTEIHSFLLTFSLRNIRVNSFTMKMEILLESTSNKLMLQYAPEILNEDEVRNKRDQDVIDLDSKHGKETPNDEHDAESDKKNDGMRSKEWDHFTFVKGETQVTCPYCKKVLAAGTKRNGTSTLIQHLKNVCKKSPVYKKVNLKNQATLSFKPITLGETSERLASHSFSQAKCRKSLAQMCIIDNRPFSVVDDQGFVEFIWDLNPLFKIPSR
ncbi:hypothetical protein Tco_0849202 [Tanacetum coccineum]